MKSSILHQQSFDINKTNFYFLREADKKTLEDELKKCSSGDHIKKMLSSVDDSYRFDENYAKEVQLELASVPAGTKVMTDKAIFGLGNGNNHIFLRFPTALSSETSNDIAIKVASQQEVDFVKERVEEVERLSHKIRRTPALVIGKMSKVLLTMLVKPMIEKSKKEDAKKNKSTAHDSCEGMKIDTVKELFETKNIARFGDKEVDELLRGIRTTLSRIETGKQISPGEKLFENVLADLLCLTGMTKEFQRDVLSKKFPRLAAKVTCIKSVWNVHQSEKLLLGMKIDKETAEEWRVFAKEGLVLSRIVKDNKLVDKNIKKLLDIDKSLEIKDEATEEVTEEKDFSYIYAAASRLHGFSSQLQNWNIERKDVVSEKILNKIFDVFLKNELNFKDYELKDELDTFCINEGEKANRLHRDLCEAIKQGVEEATDFLHRKTFYKERQTEKTIYIAKLKLKAEVLKIFVEFLSSFSHCGCTLMSMPAILKLKDLQSTRLMLNHVFLEGCDFTHVGVDFHDGAKGLKPEEEERKEAMLRLYSLKATALDSAVKDYLNKTSESVEQELAKILEEKEKNVEFTERELAKLKEETAELPKKAFDVLDECHLLERFRGNILCYGKRVELPNFNLPLKEQTPKALSRKFAVDRIDPLTKTSEFIYFQYHGWFPRADAMLLAGEEGVLESSKSAVDKIKERELRQKEALLTREMGLFRKQKRAAQLYETSARKNLYASKKELERERIDASKAVLHADNAHQIAKKNEEARNITENLRRKTEILKTARDIQKKLEKFSSDFCKETLEAYRSMNSRVQNAKDMILIAEELDKRSAKEINEIDAELRGVIFGIIDPVMEEIESGKVHLSKREKDMYGSCVDFEDSCIRFTDFFCRCAIGIEPKTHLYRRIEKKVMAIKPDIIRRAQTKEIEVPILIPKLLTSDIVGELNKMSEWVCPDPFSPSSSAEMIRRIIDGLSGLFLPHEEEILTLRMNKYNVGNILELNNELMRIMTENISSIHHILKINMTAALIHGGDQAVDGSMLSPGTEAARQTEISNQIIGLIGDIVINTKEYLEKALTCHNTFSKVASLRGASCYLLINPQEFNEIISKILRGDGSSVNFRDDFIEILQTTQAKDDTSKERKDELEKKIKEVINRMAGRMAIMLGENRVSKEINDSLAEKEVELLSGVESKIGEMIQEIADNIKNVKDICIFDEKEFVHILLYTALVEVSIRGDLDRTGIKKGIYESIFCDLTQKQIFKENGDKATSMNNKMFIDSLMALCPGFKKHVTQSHKPEEILKIFCDFDDVKVKKAIKKKGSGENGLEEVELQELDIWMKKCKAKVYRSQDDVKFNHRLYVLPEEEGEVCFGRNPYETSTTTDCDRLTGESVCDKGNMVILGSLKRSKQVISDVVDQFLMNRNQMFVGNLAVRNEENKEPWDFFLETFKDDLRDTLNRMVAFCSNGNDLRRSGGSLYDDFVNEEALQEISEHGIYREYESEINILNRLIPEMIEASHKYTLRVNEEEAMRLRADFFDESNLDKTGNLHSLCRDAARVSRNAKICHRMSLQPPAISVAKQQIELREFILTEIPEFDQRQFNVMFHDVVGLDQRVEDISDICNNVFRKEAAQIRDQKIQGLVDQHIAASQNGVEFSASFGKVKACFREALVEILNEDDMFKNICIKRCAMRKLEKQRDQINKIKKRLYLRKGKLGLDAFSNVVVAKWRNKEIPEAEDVIFLIRNINKTRDINFIEKEKRIADIIKRAGEAEALKEAVEAFKHALNKEEIDLDEALDELEGDIHEMKHLSLSTLNYPESEECKHDATLVINGFIEKVFEGFFDEEFRGILDKIMGDSLRKAINIAILKNMQKTKFDKSHVEMPHFEADLQEAYRLMDPIIRGFTHKYVVEEFCIEDEGGENGESLAIKWQKKARRKLGEERKDGEMKLAINCYYYSFRETIGEIVEATRNNEHVSSMPNVGILTRNIIVNAKKKTEVLEDQFKKHKERQEALEVKVRNKFGTAKKTIGVGLLRRGMRFLSFSVYSLKNIFAESSSIFLFETRRIAREMLEFGVKAKDFGVEVFVTGKNATRSLALSVKESSIDFKDFIAKETKSGAQEVVDFSIKKYQEYIVPNKRAIMMASGGGLLLTGVGIFAIMKMFPAYILIL